MVAVVVFASIASYFIHSKRKLLPPPTTKVYIIMYKFKIYMLHFSVPAIFRFCIPFSLWLDSLLSKSIKDFLFSFALHSH